MSTIDIGDHLERKVSELERSVPKIELTAQNSDNEPVKSMDVVVTTYEAFSEDEVEKLVSVAAERSPIVTEFREDPFSKMMHLPSAGLYGQMETKYYPPTQEEITQYKEKQYPEWLASVRKFFINLPHNKELPGRFLTISSILSNSGTVPATNLVIRFEAVGGLYFVERKSEDELSKDEKNLEFPSPPSPPKGKYVQQARVPTAFCNAQQAMLDRARSLESITQAIAIRTYPEFPIISPPDLPKPRDRNVFYWKEGRSNKSTVLSFECQEFLHKIRPEVFDIDLFIPDDGVANCAVKCLVSASNLPEPIRMILPIMVEFKRGNIKEIAEDIISESLPLIGLGGKLRDYV